MLKRVVGALAGATVALVGLAGPSWAATTGTERLLFLVRQSGEEQTCTVIASGPISGVGTCTIEDVAEGETVVHATLPGGSFDLTTTTEDESDDFNEQACIFRFTSTEAFELTGVSGDFENATGSGTDVVRGSFFAERTPQGCDEASASGFIIARATGTVTV